MTYSELYFNGVAVCGHINVSFETVFLFFKAPVQALGSPSLPFNECRGEGGAKRPGCEAGHSPYTGEGARR